VCQLIERSLGAPASYPIVSGRYHLLKIALELGLPVPDTDLAVAGRDFSTWASQHEFPWVVKADGTWGGHGTRLVRDRKEAEDVVRQMSRPLDAGRALKRLVVDRDPFWILPWRSHSIAPVIVQSYVKGYPANCAVVCWNGKVLAGIAVEVVSALGETGSATIVRVIDNPGMMRAAEQVVARLGLSGFLGFDFVIEAHTGTAYLIEMNPRVTPLCHLQLGPGRDLVSAITAELTAEQFVATPSLVENKMIAYFPQAWHADTRKELLASSFHDVPWEEPTLVRELLRLPWPDRSILARLSASIRRVAFDKRGTRSVIFEQVLAASETVPGPVTFLADPRKPPAVVPLRQNGSKHPLFLIHGVDGQIGRFYSLIRHLELDQPVYGIQARALLRQRTALTRIEQLAAYYLEQVQLVQPAGPYHLLGFSFGGYLAFEAARQLHAHGELVGMVGMIDTLPMGVGWRPAGSDSAAKPNNCQPNRPTFTVAFHAKRMLQSGGLRYAKDKLRARGLRTIYACLDSASLPIPAVLQSAPDLDWFAAVRYVPQPFPGKITLFNTAGSRERSRATYDLWSALTGRNIELHEIPGRHEDIFAEPQVKSLAIQVNDCLARAQ